eukprot:2364012-Rhodomonas_salina.1
MSQHWDTAPTCRHASRAEVSEEITHLQRWASLSVQFLTPTRQTYNATQTSRLVVQSLVPGFSTKYRTCPGQTN